MKLKENKIAVILRPGKIGSAKYEIRCITIKFSKDIAKAKKGK